MGCGPGAQTGGRVRIDGIPTVVILVEDNLVDVASALDRDEPVCNVACARLRLALRGCTEAGTARQAQNHPFAALDALLALGVQVFPARGAHFSGIAGASALQTLCRAPCTIVHGRDGPGRVATHPYLHLLTETSPASACSLRVGAQFPPVHDHWRDVLDHLGRHTADGAWKRRCGEAVVSGTRPHATAGEEYVGKGLAVLVVATDLGVPEAVRPLSQHPVRDGLRESAVDQARQEVPDDVPGADRCRVCSVEDAPFRGRDVHGAEAAIVVRHIRADRALHPEGGVGDGVVEDDVDAPLALRRSALVVQVDLISLDADGDGELYRVVEAVGVRLVYVDSVGQGSDRLPHRHLGALPDGI